MTLNKSTRYALYAAMEMALAKDRQVTATRVAGRYGIPVAVLAKVFQQLVRAGLAIGTRGTRGGYRLARPPSRLTVLDVVEAFQPPRPPGQCLLVDDEDQRCAHPGACNLRRLFDEIEEQVRCTFASVTLETLAGGRGRTDRGLRIIEGP